MEDLLEELVGEIYDESDVAPEQMTRISENEISVDGVTELRVVEHFFAIDLPGKPTDTVGFWVLSSIEYIPKEKEVFTIDNLEITIVKASSRSIERVTIRRPVAVADETAG
jgi:CBS domain containing-hemolysin-like protein